jgi:hypothetical protein
MGSTRVARRAGMYAEASVTAASSAGAAMNARVSRDDVS